MSRLFLIGASVGEPISVGFLAPQIPGVIFAQYYSGLKRKAMMDEGFLDKIDGLFLCLTATI